LCGKPLVGHGLNRKYRYYQCSNAQTYENHGKKCLAHYVRAGELEDTVWGQVREVLSNPEVVLRELTKTDNTINQETLNAEIKELEKTLRNYAHRRTKL
jgi:hypothetical protein